MPQKTRYQLTLDSLKFISLVDVPAQQTATIRLVKRKDAGDAPQIIATTNIMKVGEGENPLVYAWAFTTHDENGNPYHDLQGDAITEFLKAAEAFFASGAPSDEQHNKNASGRVAFGMPMDPTIAKAFFGDEIGAQIKTAGLMIAIRPSAEALAKVRSGEYGGVSIEGTGTRVVVDDAAAKADGAKRSRKGKKKKPGQMPSSSGYATSYKHVGKNAVLTSVEDGHQHTICLNDPADCWRDQLMTSYQTSEDEEQSHCHAWVYDAATGKITIALDSGHSHTVDAVVPPDVIAEANAPEPEPEHMCAACSVCGKCHVCEPYEHIDDKPAGATIAVSVAARAPGAVAAGVSTPIEPTNTVKSKEQVMPTEQEIRIANLSKMLAASLTLIDTHKAHAAKLAPADQEQFLLLDYAARDAAVKAADAADPEVYKTASGTSVRKSDGPLALEMAKRADEQAQLIKSQAEQLEVEKAARAQQAIEKRATDIIPLIGKSLASRVAILKGVDAIADQTLQTEALEALKGANAAMQILGKSHGATPADGPEPDDPETKLDAMAKSYAATNKVDLAKAYDAVLQTAEGGELYKQIDNRSKTPALRSV